MRTLNTLAAELAVTGKPWVPAATLELHSCLQQRWRHQHFRPVLELERLSRHGDDYVLHGQPHESAYRLVGLAALLAHCNRHGYLLSEKQYAALLVDGETYLTNGAPARLLWALELDTALCQWLALSGYAVDTPHPAQPQAFVPQAPAVGDYLTVSSYIHAPEDLQLHTQAYGQLRFQPLGVAH